MNKVAQLTASRPMNLDENTPSLQRFLFAVSSQKRAKIDYFGHVAWFGIITTSQVDPAERSPGTDSDPAQALAS
jgi:hypothetical protein